MGSKVVTFVLKRWEKEAGGSQEKRLEDPMPLALKMEKKEKHAPVAESVSTRYLHSSMRAGDARVVKMEKGHGSTHILTLAP